MLQALLRGPAYAWASAAVRSWSCGGDEQEQVEYRHGPCECRLKHYWGGTGQGEERRTKSGASEGPCERRLQHHRAEQVERRVARE